MGLHAQQDYRIIKLWEVDAQIAFQPELNALLPFVPIMEGGNSQNVVRQIGQLSSDSIQAVSLLSLERLEALGEAIFDFTTTADLEQWLSASR